MQAANDGCLRLPAGMFPEGVLNPIPRNTHSFGGFPSLSDKGSSGFPGLNSFRNPSGEHPFDSHLFTLQMRPSSPASRKQLLPWQNLIKWTVRWDANLRKR